MVGVQIRAGNLDAAFTVALISNGFIPPPPGSNASAVVFFTLLLSDWSKRLEPAIKYYSGTATYRKVFNLPQELVRQNSVASRSEDQETKSSVLATDNQQLSTKNPLYLDLGDARELVRLRLYGLDLRVLWTKPYRGGNHCSTQTRANDLEIDVVNEWPNRLIGDTFLAGRRNGGGGPT